MSENAATKSWTAAKWLPVVQSAGVLTEVLGQAKNDQARAIAVGKFLSAKVGQEIPVTQGGRTGKAVLRSAGGRARQKTYYFEVVCDAPPTAPAPAVPGAARHKGEPSRRKKSKKQKPRPEKLAAKSKRARTGGNDEQW
jgi:hypothetical protein